ncbi:SGNH/GDSL hydrolase family protein [Streptomyces lavendulae]|uniref:SGNH/GDSL hydrolase family protein n=1 Tax=Streptomyces lavendulae TaxID=1914 RepID=UPI00332DFBD9
MPLGDSITAGVGSSTGGGYRLPLWQELAGRGMQVDFVGSERGGGFEDPDHEGHSGYMIDQIRARIDGWLGQAQPDVVLLHLGINDLDRGERPGAADRLVALIDRIERDQPGITVIVQGLIPTTGGLEGEAITFNAMVRSEVDSHGFRWVEPPALQGGEMADRLHPNDLGYQRMAEAFVRSLDASLEPSPARRCPWTTSS